MGFGPFDKAHLGVVGYASVAANGTVKASSGLTVERTPTGIYFVRALVDPTASPALPANQVPVFSAADIVQDTPNHSSPCVVTGYYSQPHEVVVIISTHAGAPLDADFSLTVLRPLAPL